MKNILNPNFNRNKARLSILNTMFSFPTIQVKNWETNTLHGTVIRVGDLVCLACAPKTKWYLSWVREVVIKENTFCDRYLLESIDDGDCCWWENVHMEVWNRSEIKPQWRWTDNQFSFNTKWLRFCHKTYGFNSYRPCQVVFDLHPSVRLQIRHKYDREKVYSKCFPNWRKVTKKIMGEFYEEAVKKLGENENQEIQESQN